MTAVLVVGAGRMGTRTTSALGRLEKVVAGVVEPDDAAFDTLRAATGPVPRYHDLAAGLAESDADVVAVCTPTPLHAAQAGAALAAGRHVLCEKPLARTVAEVNQLAKLATAGNLSLRIGYHYRHHPSFERLRRRIADGALGEPSLAMLRIGGRGSHREWKHRRGAGGAVAEMASHMVDLAGWLLAPIASASILDSETQWPQRDIDGVPVDVDAEDVAVIGARTEQGTPVVIVADLVSRGFTQSVDVAGSNGSAQVSIIDGLPDRYSLVAAAADLDAGETLEQGVGADLVERYLECALAEIEEGVARIDDQPARTLAGLLEQIDAAT